MIAKSLLDEEKEETKRYGIILLYPTRDEREGGETRDEREGGRR